ncbi:MAG: VCBS repeat-containing protein, partial [Planctomycetes bacterium]|nr:VCBS repeat-containing protein [Planctomycetota bacterium]
ELDLITAAGSLNITAVGAGTMTVNAVSGGGTITGTTTLTAGGTGVTFASTSSNFDNALIVASAAIVGVNISTSNDALTFNNTVVLNGNSTIDTGAGNILFSSSLNGAFILNAKSSSTTTFGGIVGGVGVALTSITVNSGGTTIINGGAITTTGNQTYNDAITLGADTILTTGTGNILFGSTITDGMSAFNLNLNAGAVGAISGTSVNINNLIITNGASAAFTDAVNVNDLITTANPYSVSMTGTGNTFAQNVEFLNTGAVTLNGTLTDSSTFTGGLVVTAPSSVTMKGTLAATNSNMILGDSNTGVILATNTTLNAGTGNIYLDGTVSGAFSLTPITATPGLTVISGPNTNTTTNVTTGVVQINNSLPQITNYAVSGGTLKGTGAIGNLTGTGNGIIAPGNSPGQVTTTSLSLSPTNTLQIELAGTIPGTQYDQIVVGSSGTVTLGNAILTLSSTYAGSAGSVFTIVDNQGIAAVVGTFSGLPEGSVIFASGKAYTISYVGGTGNDVTLTAIPTVTLNIADLVITTTTLTITGTGFDTTPSNNMVTFNNGAIGTVSSATSTQLVINFSTQPTSTGSLTAVVTTNSLSSGTPIQVATIVPAPTPAPLVTGTPPPSSGGSSTVSLYDPVTGQPTGTVVPFPGFTGEIRVVSGDFNGDGKADIIAAAGPGGGPAIVVLDSETGAVMESFFAFDPAFTGGVFITAQDFNGDGILDIIAGAGAGGGPEVRIFDGTNLSIARAFFAYDQAFTGGVTVAALDFNGDGILDLVTGAGPGGAPHVKVFDGATNSIISQWFAYPISFTGGVFVAAGDISNDGNIEVVTGA